MNMFDDMDDNWESKTRMTPEELEETTNYLKNHPLFIKEVPENLENHPELLALQNLIYDDTPENIARSFKEKGNEHFKKGAGKRYFIKQAIIAYTEGIDAGSSEKDVNAQLYNNRALMEMKLKNLGKAIDDCKKAIEFDPLLIKAHFRKAQIESMLRRYDQSLLSCLIGLHHEPENKELLALKKESERQIELERNRREKIEQETEEQTALLHAECKKRRIYLGAKQMDFPESCRTSIFVDEKKMLHFPMFVHYPEFHQMDYIADSNEKDVLHDHLATIFKDPLPWDEKNYYDINSIEVYIEFNQTKPLYKPTDIKTWPSQQGLKKINPNLIMSYIFAIRGYVLPSVPEITIVSTKSPFYTKFKQEFDFV